MSASSLSSSGSNSFDSGEAPRPRGRRPGLVSRVCTWGNSLTGRLLYQYYNWRKDTFSDLQLFLGFNAALFCLGASIQGALFRSAAPGLPPGLEETHPAWWLDLYAVFKTVFGQDMPELDSAFPTQVFAVATVAVGLASFALVLALVEQVLLEVLNANVKTGSSIWESGHTVLLCWCESAEQTQQIIRMLKQLCLAYREEGGRTIVVLTQRGKLEMEAAFASRIPRDRRHGSTLVFRCGSPLDPAALRLVSCQTAGSIILSGDYSRPPLESDTQVVRAAVLLDELLLRQQHREAAAAAREGRQATLRGLPTVVAQIKSHEAQESLRYACGPRVHVLASKRINAERVARTVGQPVAAALLREMNDFGSSAHLALRPLPRQLAGITVGDVMRHLPDATLMGLRREGGRFGAWGHSSSSSGGGSSDSMSSGGGWGQASSSSGGSSSGGGATLLNPPADMQVLEGDHLVLLCGSTVTVLQQPMPTPAPLMGALPAGLQQRQLANGSGGSGNGSRGPPKGILQPTISTDEPDTDLESWVMSSSSSSGGDAAPASALHGHARHAHYTLPAAYHEAPRSPQRVLLCGWGCQEAMEELLGALDSGPVALPPGSILTLVNQHRECREALGRIVGGGGVANIQVRHVLADPRSRAALASAVDAGNQAAAVIVSDALWLSGTGAVVGEAAGPAGDQGPAEAPLAAGSGGALPGGASLPDALRMDAAVLAVQLNLRILEEASGGSPMNIVCEKQSHTGVTRFEDMDRLPLGVTFCNASFSARLLAQVAVDPRFLEAYQQLGAGVELATADASELAGEQEELTYAQLQQRALRLRQAVLLGSYKIPESHSGIQLALSPAGPHAHTTPKVWNAGDGRCKLLLLVSVPSRGAAAAERKDASCVPQVDVWVPAAP